MRNEMEKPVSKLETIKTPDGNQISFYPERGGIITSLKFKGEEVLYMDETTLNDQKVSVRGGIPILFPNAGPLESPKYPNLKQHGFARDSSNWKIQKNNNGFKETLVLNKETREVFPYDFNFSMEVKFEENGSFTINQIVENLEEKEDLPISMGLHPYFKIPQDKKGEIKFNFEGGRLIEEQVELWANGKPISIDNPKIKDLNSVMVIVIPSLGNLVIDASFLYKKIWVWSMPGKDFVCIEPVMRDIRGLVDDPEMIKPKETLIARVNFDLKK